MVQYKSTEKKEIKQETKKRKNKKNEIGSVDIDNPFTPCFSYESIGSLELYKI